MEELPSERAGWAERVSDLLNLEAGCSDEHGELLRLESVSFVIVLFVVLEPSEPAPLFRTRDVHHEVPSHCKDRSELLNCARRVSNVLEDIHTPHDTTPR